jgi:aspartyl-tRNA(Asn)/glutamyl-tRNA(Gln) amidotransferase subunit A
MTTSVADAALMLGAMAGTPRQAARWLAAAEAPERPAFRLGVCDWWLSDLAPGVEAAVRDAIRAFEAARFEIRDVSIEGLAEAHAGSGVITGAEALAFHQQRLEQDPEGIGPRVRARMEKAYGLTAVDYVRAQEAQVMVMAGFAAAFREVDCLIGATLPALPPRIEEHAVRIGGEDIPVLDAFTRLNAVANMAGLPALSLPCAKRSDGLPVGLQLIAAPGREDVVLALGGWYERVRSEK